MDVACKVRVRQCRSDPNISADEFDAVLATERDNLAAKDTGYFVFLLETILRDVHLTADMKDVVSFLIVLPTLRSRKNLFYLIRLSCLCLTERRVDLPAIKFHEVDTSKPKCSLVDMLLPAQSYLTNCSQSVAYCTSETSISKFRDINRQFISGRFAEDPWTHVDSFGCSTFQKGLVATV